MSFGNAIRTCFSKYVTFSGRASRPEYWWFFLFLVLASAVAGVIDWMFFTQTVTVTTDAGSATAARSNQPVQGLFGLVTLLPHLAVAWRRMHDTGRSGFYVLFPLLLSVAAGLILLFGIGLAEAFASGGSMDILFTRLTLLVLIPTVIVLMISPLLVLWWLSRPSQPGTNDYGPNPYEVSQ